MTLLKAFLLVIAYLFLTSCTIYNNSTVLTTIKDASLKVSDYPNVADNKKMVNPIVTSEQKKKIQTSQATVVRKDTVRNTKKGCEPFKLPDLLPHQKLSGSEMSQLKPKNSVEIASILLDNMSQNNRIDKLNRETLKQAHDKHLQTCK